METKNRENRVNIGLVFVKWGDAWLQEGAGVATRLLGVCTTDYLLTHFSLSTLGCHLLVYMLIGPPVSWDSAGTAPYGIILRKCCEWTTGAKHCLRGLLLTHISALLPLCGLFCGTVLHVGPYSTPNICTKNHIWGILKTRSEAAMPLRNYLIQAPVEQCLV